MLVAVIGVYVTFASPQHLTDDAKELTPIVSETEETEEVLIETQLVVDEQVYSMSIAEGTNVIDFMKLVQSKNEDFSFSGTEYEGMGMLVEQINEVENNMDESMFWSLYVNDELAQVGASQYLIQDGDKIEWRYEKVEF